MNALTNNGATLLGVMWITTRKGNLTIILFANSVGKIKSYIGETEGKDSNEDVSYVYNFGTKFPLLGAYESIRGAGQFFIDSIEVYQNILTQNALGK